MRIDLDIGALLRISRQNHHQEHRVWRAILPAVASPAPDNAASKEDIVDEWLSGRSAPSIC